MKTLLALASTIVCLFGVSTASASSVYYASSAGGHSMYLAGHQYHFEPGAIFTDNGATASLTGIALRNGDGFNINLNFTKHTGSATPKKELGASHYGTGPNQVDPSTWSLWDLVETGPDASTIEGVFGFAGYDYLVESKPANGNHVFQSGFGANGKNKKYGLSGWFSLVENFGINFNKPLGDVVNGCTIPAGAAQSPATCDFNVTLVAAPLPAPALLLIGGLAGLGFMRRRKAIA